ncbi:hypothetical protein PVAND_015555 [Polypedilum vanderplanki]|uniref:Uncharacterized protein n=1 Tax=Polypedilum vanderplanki TaxID=319348 RepID=A0A9J6BCZ4_POLVA|nr:hypothetical protein PVAND_015555 [Polypedilum vanderplanki]
MKIFFIFIAIFISKATADTIECNFYMASAWWQMDRSYYFCETKNNNNVTQNFKVPIISAMGKHTKGKTDLDVEGIHLYGTNFKQFPTNIDKVFPNLVMIAVSYSKLEQLTSDDFNQFPKLRLLYIWSNLVEFIPENIFGNNLNLELIYLGNNKIEHIDKNAFSNLNSLRALYLKDNICKTLGQAITRTDVINLVKLIEQGSCQSDKCRCTYANFLGTTENPLITKVSEQAQEIENLQSQLKFLEQCLFFIFYLINLLIFISQINAESIICKYTEVKGIWQLDRSVLTCDVTNLLVFGGHKINVNDIQVNHPTKKKFADIEGFQVTRGKTLKYFPTGVGNFFPNLIMINIPHSGLIEITRKDLQQFPNLKMLFILNNYLEYIPEDLFMHNPHITVIDFEKNKIQHIDPKVFSNLKNLRAIDLRNNVNCNYFGKALERSEVEKLVKKVEEGKCQSDKYERFKEKIIQIAELENELNKQKIENELLVNNNQNLLNNVRTFHEKIGTHCNNTNLIQKLKDLEKHVTTFSTSNTGCKTEFESIKSTLKNVEILASEAKASQNSMHSKFDSFNKNYNLRKDLETEATPITTTKDPRTSRSTKVTTIKV